MSKIATKRTEHRLASSNLLFDENFIGMMNKSVDNNHLVPAAFPAIMLNDETQYHDRFHHQLTKFRLSDLVENCFNLQRKLDLTGCHLQQKCYRLGKMIQLIQQSTVTIHTQFENKQSVAKHLEQTYFLGPNYI